jgi:predicted nucleic acid-binding protein
MRRVFADTNYWIALFSKKDSLHARASQCSRELANCVLVTSEIVLTEFGNFFSSYGQFFRQGAGDLIEQICNDPNIEVEPQTTQLFRRSLAEYMRYGDKKWSFTDCASIVIMRTRSLQDVLTNDPHFEQAGFTILLG